MADSNESGNTTTDSQELYSTKILSSRDELRFSLSPPTSSTSTPSTSTTYHLKLLKGTAEIFGSPLPLNIPFTLKDDQFHIFSFAIFTWYGCTISINLALCTKIYVVNNKDNSDSIYPTLAMINSNVNYMHGNGGRGNGGKREESKEVDDKERGYRGIRIAVIGTEGVGKTTAARILTAYQLRSNSISLETSRNSSKNLNSAKSNVVYVDLNSTNPTISLPGSISATTNPSSILISGVTNTATADNHILGYFVGSKRVAESPELYQCALRSLSNSVNALLDSDVNDSCTVIIDTFGLGLGGRLADEEVELELLRYALDMFNVDIVLSIGAAADRYVHELKGISTKSSRVFVRQGGAAWSRNISTTASGGAKIREYFEGTQKFPLWPTKRQVKLPQDIKIVKLHDRNIIQEALLPVNAVSAAKPLNGTVLEEIESYKDVEKKLIAITHEQDLERMLNLAELSFDNNLTYNWNTAGFVFCESVESGGEDSVVLNLLCPNDDDFPGNIFLFGDISWNEF